MSTFKVGDHVRCIDNSGEEASDELDKETIYVVDNWQGAHASTTDIFLVGQKKSWRASRFELAEEKIEEKIGFKVGDRVRCVRAENAECRLKEGEIYHVARVNSNLIYVRAANGEDQGWFSSRFELVDDEQPIDPKKLPALCRVSIKLPNAHIKGGTQPRAQVLTFLNAQTDLYVSMSAGNPEKPTFGSQTLAEMWISPKDALLLGRKLVEAYQGIEADPQEEKPFNPNLLDEECW